MMPYEFFLWLKGYLDGLGVDTLNKVQLDAVKAKINTVKTI